MPTTAAIRQIKRDVRARFVVVEDSGTFDCRKKRNLAGETIGGWSQHAWGNAWDVTLEPADAAKRYLEDHPKVVRVIDYRPRGGSHFHIDGAPEQSGTPPCAQAGGESDSPPVMNPPRDDDTARVPVGPTPPGMEDREGGIREGSAADRALSPLQSASDVLDALGDPDTWKRVLWALGGLVALVAAIVILAGDLLPSGRAARAVAGAAT